MAADPRPVTVETTPPPLPVCPAAGQPDPPAPSNEILGNRIADLAARIQAATWELLVLIRQFDAGGGWEGFASCAAWLSWRIGLAPGAAREHVRVARALAELPKLSDAMRRGAVSYSKLRAVTRVATPETEQALLDVALAGTAAHVEQVVRTWRRVDRAAEQAEEQQRHESRALDTWVDDGGMVVVRGRLTPEVGAVVRRALEAALDAAPPNAGGPAAGGDGQPRSAAVDGAAGDAAEAMVPTVAQQRADALGMVAECALAGGLDKGTAGDRYQVVVHVDADTLAEGGRADENVPGDNAAGDSAATADGRGAAADAAGDEGRATAAPDVPQERRGGARPRRPLPSMKPPAPRQAARTGRHRRLRGGLLRLRSPCRLPRRRRRAGRPRVQAPAAASRCSTRPAASTSPRRQPGGSRATPRPSRCTTGRPARCSTSAAGPGPSRPRCAGRWRRGTGTAASPAARRGAPTRTTCNTGRTAGRQRSTTSSCCAGGITGRCTRAGSAWRSARTATCASCGPTAGR